MKVNDILEVKIIDYDHSGLGVAKLDNFPIFVPYALKDETVQIRITKVKKNIAEALLLNVIEYSNDRETNICKYYYSCGGCSLFHMKYKAQLEFKKNSVQNTLHRIGGIDLKINDIVANPNPLHYRNKIIVPLQYKDGKIVSGFYKPKTHEIVESDECLIEALDSQKIISEIKILIKKYNLSIYNESTNKGLFRNIMLRVNYINEYMVVFIVKKNVPELVRMAFEIVSKFKNIKSVYACVNKEKTNVILKGKFIHLLLDKYLIEDINGLKFIVHPNSFLQVNHDQCENLYNKALSYIPKDYNKNIIDAYCGIGSITLNLSKHANHVYGIEIVKEAIDNANVNKKLNEISNVSFICGKCEEEISKLVKVKDVEFIIFDPPRKGCDVSFLDVVINMGIKNIIYISCMPQTLARDLKYLCENGYKVIEVTPYDMFSQTSHIETVVYLKKTIV